MTGKLVSLAVAAVTAVALVAAAPPSTAEPAEPADPAGPAGVPAHGDGAPSAASMTALTWNICGWKSDACPDGLAVRARADAVARSIADHGAQVAFFQEICQGHVRAIRDRLGDGWSVRFTPYVSRKSGTDVKRHCDAVDGPEGYGGLAIAVQEPGLTNDDTTLDDLPRDDTAYSWLHQLYCLTTASHGQLCTVHLAWNSTEVDGKLVRGLQIARVAELLAGEKQVIVGGDFNNPPPDNEFPPDTDPQVVGALAPMYENLHECDQVNFDGGRAGSPTHVKGKKLDSIFATGASTACEVQPDPGGGSGEYLMDHHALVATLPAPAT